MNLVLRISTPLPRIVLRSRRGTPALGVALLCSALSANAFGQTGPTRPAGETPITAEVIDKQLSERASLIRKVNPQGADRIVVHTLAWPGDAAEYRALGRNGVLLITAVSRNASELPLAKVYVRMEGRDIPLRKLSSRRTETAAGSLVRTMFGPYREDALFLAPGGLMLSEAPLMARYALQDTQSRVNSAPVEVPPFVRNDQGEAAEPSASALKTFVERRFPGFPAPR